MTAVVVLLAGWTLSGWVRALHRWWRARSVPRGTAPIVGESLTDEQIAALIPVTEARRYACDYAASLIDQQLARAHRGEPWQIGGGTLALDTFDHAPPNVQVYVERATSAERDAVAEEMALLAEELRRWH